MIIRIPPAAARSYPVHFSTSWPDLARKLDALKAERVIVVADHNAFRIHGNAFIAALDAPGRRRPRRPQTSFVLIPAGGAAKTRAVKARLEDSLLARGADRDTVLAAFGGGSTGDLAGFTAATFMRGIRYVQVPTTLLAQVDSSVGGKTALDHPSGKNLIGAFHQPSAVLVNPRVLDSLPPQEYRSGMSEVIKTALILDRAMAMYLLKLGPRLEWKEELHPMPTVIPPDALMRVVRRCISLKAAVVAKDERESGYRRILNFGHTVGHAVESLSHGAIRHGYAVAIGMALEARIARAVGLLDESGVHLVDMLLGIYGLPGKLPARFATPAGVRDIMRAIAGDKKSKRGRVLYTLISAPGRAVIGVDVPDRIVTAVLSGRSLGNRG